MPDPTATETLGRFVAASRWEDIPEALRHEAKRSLLNHIGCALGTARDPVVRIAAKVMRGLSAAPAATVFGQGLQLDAMGAAFVNAVAANLLDYDDTHLDTVIHPAAPVAPPLFALAEQRGLSGAAVLHAFLLGGEVACRIGNAVSPGHYARGWHITSTCGAFGAAAGCARLLGLDSAQAAQAIGIASSEAAGTVENLPTAAKNVGVGNAARHGILAALFAAEGWQAAPAAIEGPLGWARACGDEADMAAITTGLGERWEIGRNTYKPYPAGIVFHAVIDACLALRTRPGVAPEAIQSVTVAGDALLLARGDRTVRNERDLRVSIHHSAALGLLRGRAGVLDFEAPALADAALAAMRARVTAVLDEALPRGAARVTLRLADGRVETATVIHPRGSEATPLTDAELETKFRDNAALGGCAERAAAQIEAIWALDRAPDLTRLMALLA
ncbi:MmgE/PrpD family protein [Paracraurococcus lichenis]|uniref:MmgE/PrpD family protein n=1 Tax=Paracraurococcus lichenis TaxID=3064888 RepID=A0ABT9DXB2_9PROT|nr:MmgE/PrpD family protein [Paracraurococcus sp. LOR1-02]MDO9708541.1 MmgE/PrpD family protein [Paracraurococcus sp. LOR1-02]